MINPSQLLRLIHISHVLARHGLDEIILATHLIRPIRFLIHLSPWRWYWKPSESRATRIRRALEDLGPIFVKFGQMLSTRRDLLPDDLAEELAKLQDRVPPFPGAEAKRIIEQALGTTVEEAFESFDEAPLASASIAQVHAARLKGGNEVVVKVLRPGIEQGIRRDLELLHVVARMADRYWKEGRRLRPREVVDEYEKTILDELDLMREAGNASQLRRNWDGTGMLYIPEVHWPLCRRNVMVMERIGGIPVSDVPALRAAGCNLKVLADRGVEIFFSQVFNDNFFHADMHPGNIFVNVDDPENPYYLSVDFGIMGSLTPADQRYMAENLLAFFRRDYHRVAELHVISEWVPSGTRVDEFEAAIRSVCEPIFEKPFKEISFGHLLVRLFQTARRFDMKVQPQLVLLEKTLLYIEGLGRQLYPDLDLWQTAKPFLENWVGKQIGPRAMLREAKARAPRWSEIAPAMPELVHDVLQKARDGNLKLNWESRRLEEEIRRANRRTVTAIIGAALLISAFVVYGLGGFSSVVWGGAPGLTWLLGALGIVMFSRAWPDDE